MGSKALKTDKFCLLTIAKGNFRYVSQRQFVCLSLYKEVHNFWHLLENSIYKLFWSKLAMLAWYSHWYKWCLFNSIFLFFFFQLAMKHKCWDTAQRWNLPERNWKVYRFSSFYRRSRLVCFFPSSSVEMHSFSFCAGKDVAFLPFWLIFCFFFVILLHSPAVLCTCISVVTGAKANGNWTKWPAHQD